MSSVSLISVSFSCCLPYYGIVSWVHAHSFMFAVTFANVLTLLHKWQVLGPSCLVSVLLALKKAYRKSTCAPKSLYTSRVPRVAQQGHHAQHSDICDLSACSDVPEDWQACRWWQWRQRTWQCILVFFDCCHQSLWRCFLMMLSFMKLHGKPGITAIGCYGNRHGLLPFVLVRSHRYHVTLPPPPFFFFFCEH